MAPLTVAAANLAYDKAITKLKRACTELELNIPPADTEDTEASVISQGARHQPFLPGVPWDISL